MGMLLAFAPFIVFAVLDRLVGSTFGLAGGALVSAALLVRDCIVPGRSPKVLEIGTVLLFSALLAWRVLGGWDPSIIEVRLYVDAGLLLVVLVSMMIGRPFTLQYAREQVDPALWKDPAFKQVNYVITGVWAAAFAVMVVADLVMLGLPGVSPRVGVLATILALVGAIRFTDWYPRQQGPAAA